MKRMLGQRNLRPTSVEMMFCCPYKRIQALQQMKRMLGQRNLRLTSVEMKSYLQVKKHHKGAAESVQYHF